MDIPPKCTMLNWLSGDTVILLGVFAGTKLLQKDSSNTTLYSAVGHITVLTILPKNLEY